LAGTPLAVDAAAAKRATQIDPAGIAGMREKPNPAVRTISGASLQFRVRLQNRVQRRLIAEHQRAGRFVLMPIWPERESLLDGDDKKARFSVIMSILHTTSSYPIDAQASRGRARFFRAPRSSVFCQAAGNARWHPAFVNLARRPAMQPPPNPKGLLERKNGGPPFFFSK
jgi:hypothetical protein